METVARGVTIGTRQSYRAAPTLWQEYGKTEGAYPADDPFLERMPQESALLILVRFLNWMVEVKGLPPQPACKVFTGLRFQFVIAFKSIAYFRSEQVAMAKKGHRASTRHVRFVSRRNGQPLPFLLDLLEDLRSSYWCHPDATIDMMMAYISVAFGVCLGTRPGEVSSDGPYIGETPKARKEDHRYYLCDLLFEAQTLEEGLYTFEEYLALPFPRPSLDLIKVTKESSKVSGRQADGLVHYLTRGNEMETKFFNDLIRWIFELCGVTDGNTVLFSRNARVSKDPNRVTNLKLTTKMYTEAMRTVAVQHDLPEDCFTGKSPRIFAGTNTAAAGRSEIHTQNLLGHSSVKSSIQYQSLIASSRAGGVHVPDPNWTPGATVTSFADPCMFSVADLKRNVKQRIHQSRAVANPKKEQANMIVTETEHEQASAAAPRETIMTAMPKLRIKKPIIINSERNRAAEAIMKIIDNNDHMKREGRTEDNPWVSWFTPAHIKLPVESEDEGGEQDDQQVPTTMVTKRQGGDKEESESSEDGGRLLGEGV